MPQTRAKSYQSKLYHEKMVREILLQEVNDLPIYKDYNKAKQSYVKSGKIPISFKRFKKQWISSVKVEDTSKVKKIAAETVEHQSEGFKSLDLFRTEQVLQADLKSDKIKQGKILLNVVKDQGEVLISTSYEDLHKHGYKPFMRWGVMKETLTAACILESGILEKAKRTGKLHVWDPFCGSGSFLIEMLMMMME
jgi:23S rRNA G2445 N2-methylase RlmL